MTTIEELQAERECLILDYQKAYVHAMKAERERDALLRENEELHDGMDDLIGENEALHKDALRYRHVRDNIHMGDGENGCDRWSVDLPNTGATLDFEALFDDAVDSAMGGK